MIFVEKQSNKVQTKCLHSLDLVHRDHLILEFVHVAAILVHLLESGREKI